MQTHGQPPDAMLDQGTKTKLCFTKGLRWTLKVSLYVSVCPPVLQSLQGNTS